MMKIVIVGSGPVGSFMAALCSFIGFIVIVYEKREEFTRNINLKIRSNFFKEVHEILNRLDAKTNFFLHLHDQLEGNNNKILIKELEKKCSNVAKAHGAVYITKEVKTFGEVYENHKISRPIVLDCTGKNSSLRIDAFGPDRENLVEIPLQNAMYINFKAKVTDKLSLYQAIKYIKNIKLTEVVIGKEIEETGFRTCTIPVFITEELAKTFDKEFPDINRNPINPFSTARYISKSLFFPISSLLGNLIVDGCAVDLHSVSVKKIEIVCGYARKRSNDNLICLGDSAAQLAFFKSLNVGLKHALELFIKLSRHHDRAHLQQFDIISQFKADNPHTNPIRMHVTAAHNVFLIVTRVLLYGCFIYCSTTRKTTRLTSPLGVAENQIDGIFQELNRKLASWSYSMIEFEQMRDREIRHEINSNKEKNVLYDQLSWFISLNGKSVIKLSEFSRAVSGKYSLYQKDFEFLMKCFEKRRKVINALPEQKAILIIKIVKRLLHQAESSEL